MWYNTHMTQGEDSTKKNKGGRPEKYNAEQRQEIMDDFKEYIINNDDPTIVGFTASYWKYSINKDYIGQKDQFSELRRRAIEKQEAYLLKGATKNDLNASVSIFRLKQKQHGYKDRTDDDDDRQKQQSVIIYRPEKIEYGEIDKTS